MLLVLRRLPQSIQARLVPLVISVAEVEPRDVHPGVYETFQLRHLPARGSEGADYLGPTIHEFGGPFDGVDGDETAGEEGDLGGVGEGHGSRIGDRGCEGLFWVVGEGGPLRGCGAVRLLKIEGRGGRGLGKGLGGQK
uniref:Uncharacterized protein n=2 Tax=Trieres chinensis TaxID=1514140 RepID=A0A7S2E8C8_TRICV